MAVKNKVQLITYPDSLGGNLKTLNKTLETHFKGLFEGGIHILPPYPSSGDRGFAPLTYLEIDSAFGDWNDIRTIGQKHDVLLDLMVNHISQQSPFFQEFLEKGKESEFADLFITLNKIWKDGEPVQKDIDKMFLRRKVPYSEFEIKSTGQKERVWTTFGKTNPSEQIDLDIHSQATKDLLEKFLTNFKAQGIKIVRLDAVGYVIKKLGTSCFFVEPEIYQFLDWISYLAKSLDLELLPEVHSHYSIQYKLAEHGHWIYDFILPYRILEFFINKSSANLKEYLKNRPEKQFTMLDCHDGVPVKPDLDELINTDEARKIVDVCVDRGANLSLIVSDDHKAPDGFDVHQIRCSYYSVLNSDDNAYLAARAIQFFVPGVPQVYYVGMLAGENDTEAVKSTGEGREINRHNFSMDEIDVCMKKEVVQRLQKLIRFRNNHEAFDGTFSVVESNDDELCLLWTRGKVYCRLSVDLNDKKSVIHFSDKDNNESVYLI
ncbi:sucrose phosphorylase [Carboxylicivirga caseinilyticus]|uniref:sucrose phosphorylase n=1 Tax=Carboxylicivirga caseinilyticus TaxID=3417572 RepID=UPI003D33BFBD|nr:sucrose phosphorylase [Marinilabiliaceae bacterium A049]